MRGGAVEDELNDIEEERGSKPFQSAVKRCEFFVSSPPPIAVKLHNFTANLSNFSDFSSARGATLTNLIQSKFLCLEPPGGERTLSFFTNKVFIVEIVLSNNPVGW